MPLWSLSTPRGRRLAVGPLDVGPTEYLPSSVTLDSMLDGSGPTLAEACIMGSGESVSDVDQIVAPVESQDVWACGVTYLRSRDARMEESDAPDFYDLVYQAERPEVFWKSNGWRVRGPGQTIGIRADSTWDVPEPELGAVTDARGSVVGYVIANDVSSRSIEGENPLYLPQAKCFDGSLALGPCIVPAAEAPELGEMTIELSIERDGATVYSDRVDVSDLRRSPAELADWLYRAMTFPVGAILCTGTAIVPPTTFTLRANDEVTIEIDGLGALTNPVELVGAVQADPVPT